MSEKNWEKFEIAVAKLIDSLDQNAVVMHDVDIPDKDTGEDRQRDVWIEGKIANHFPVSVLVSCKRWNKKLSSQDIDAFIGELISSGAQKGVIYSYTGFTDPAIKKAKEKGISCCRLYNNQPPDIPDSLLFKSYCSRSYTELIASDDLKKLYADKTWGDIFKIESENSEKSVLDYLVDAYQTMEEKSLDKAKNGEVFPENYQSKITIFSEDDENDLFVVMNLFWKIYRSKIEAHLIDGSYSVTDDDFKGSQIVPSIDRMGENPGEGWELMDEKPEIDNSSVINSLTYSNDIKKGLLDNLADKVISK